MLVISLELERDNDVLVSPYSSLSALQAILGDWYIHHSSSSAAYQGPYLSSTSYKMIPLCVSAKHCQVLLNLTLCNVWQCHGMR